MAQSTVNESNINTKSRNYIETDYELRQITCTLISDRAYLHGEIWVTLYPDCKLLWKLNHLKEENWTALDKDQKAALQKVRHEMISRIAYAISLYPFCVGGSFGILGVLGIFNANFAPIMTPFLAVAGTLLLIGVISFIIAKNYERTPTCFSSNDPHIQKYRIAGYSGDTRKNELIHFNCTDALEKSKDEKDVPRTLLSLFNDVKKMGQLEEPNNIEMKTM